MANRELVPREPLRSVLGLQDEVNDLFRNFFRGFGGRRVFDWSDDGAWMPLADVEETDDAYIVSCDVPGMGREDLTISIQENVLSIHGERKRERDERKRGRVLSERSYGSFDRAFTLPGTVDADKVKASCRNGVLTITLPKKPEAKPRQIEVKVD
jgi:HSP20 family protein